MSDKKQSNGLIGMPESTRPRERLEKLGAKSLSDQELLAIILRTGGRNQDVIQLAFHVFSQFENLYELKKATLNEIQKIKGIGKVKAIEIQAAIELGRRITSSQQMRQGKIHSTVEMGQVLLQEMKDLEQEHLRAVYLTTKNQIIKQETIFIGSLNQSIAHPREIFKGAVKCSAAKIILAHNHPSGHTEPSKNDQLFTHRMIECGEIMGIELLDHFIIGRTSYLSLKESGVV